MSKNVQIGLVQMSCTADVESNIQKAITGIREAAQKGAQIVCLQELFTSLYFCDVEDHHNFSLAEAIPGPTTERLGKVAGELGVVIVASLFEKRAQGLYHNTTAVLDADGAYLGKYRKMHIPDDPGYYEKFYFTPGDLGYKVFDTKFARNRGVDLLGSVVSRSSPHHGPDGCRSAFLSHRHRLGYHRTGPQSRTKNSITPGRRFSGATPLPTVCMWWPSTAWARKMGSSSGVGRLWLIRSGSLLYLAPHEEEVVHVQTVDLALSEKYRTTWPYFRDRRIDSYQPITKRYIDE